MISNVSAAIINPIIGKAADTSLIASLKVCVIICILICIIFLLYSRNEKLKNAKKYDEVIVHL